MSNETKAIIKKPEPGTIEALKSFLFERKIHLGNIMPDGANPDKLIASALLSARNSQALLRCDPQSVFLSLMTAADLNLPVHWGPMGLAALVPYGKKAQLIIGYRGYIDLMMRGDLLKGVHAGLVRQGDKWKHYVTDRGVVVRHEPADDDQDDGTSERPVRFAYAVAYYAKGGCEVAISSRADFEKVKAGVLAKISGDQYKTREQKIAESPYTTSTDAMWKKRAVRRLSTMVPLTVEMGRAVEHEEQVEKDMGDIVRLDQARPITITAQELPASTGIPQTIEAPTEKVAVEKPQEAKGRIVDESTTPDAPRADGWTDAHADQMDQWLNSQEPVPESVYSALAKAANTVKGEKRSALRKGIEQLKARVPKPATETKQPGEDG